MKEQIRSLALSARIALNLHALNNEKVDGNATIPREVGITFFNSDNESQIVGTNAISGYMLKHMYLEKFRNLAEEWSLPLSPAAKLLDPRRIDSSKEFDDLIAMKATERQIADYCLTCSMTDIAGLMLARKGVPPLKRRSTINFGMAVAIPGYSETKSLKQTRHPTYGDYDNKIAGDTDPTLFTVPSSSGIYAFIARIEADRIGFNDIARTYPAEVAGIQIERQLRFRAALTALTYFVIDLKGAKTNSQMPHSFVLDGFFSVSTGTASAVLQSAISGATIEDAFEKAQKINILQGRDTVKIYPFEGENQLLQAVIDILDQYEAWQPKD